MSLVLAIEISNPSAWTPTSPARPGVAVGKLTRAAAELIGAEPIDPSRIHDDDLMPAIDRLFRAYGLSPRDISRIAVSVGPGGFTATRIAVTAAKLIAHARGAQCVAVPSAAVAHAAHIARRQSPPGETVVALASKGESVHLTQVSVGGEIIGTPHIAAAADVDFTSVQTLLADRFSPPLLLERARAAGVAAFDLVFDPAALLAIEYRYPAATPLDLAPIYPREPEAVTKWRELKRLGKK